MSPIVVWNWLAFLEATYSHTRLAPSHSSRPYFHHFRIWVHRSLPWIGSKKVVQVTWPIFKLGRHFRVVVLGLGGLLYALLRNQYTSPTLVINAMLGGLDQNVSSRDEARSEGGATFTADAKADAIPTRPQLDGQDTS